MATAPRTRYRPRFRTILLLFAVAMILWSGFSYWAEYSENAARRARERLAPPLGVECVIKLDSPNATLEQGIIIDQSDRWIVFQQADQGESEDEPDKKLWIPRERILSIEFKP